MRTHAATRGSGGTSTKRHMGMTVLPEYLAGPLLKRNELVVLHEPDVAPLNALYVATRRPVAAPDPIIEMVRSQIVALCRALP